MGLSLLPLNFNLQTSRKVSRHIPQHLPRGGQTGPSTISPYHSSSSFIRLKIQGGNALKIIHKYREHCFLFFSPKYKEVKYVSSIKPRKGVVHGFLDL